MSRSILAGLIILAAACPGWSQQADKKPASFSDLALGSGGVVAGRPVWLKASVHNDSGQDWASETYDLFVVVSKDKKILRKTPPIPIRKAVAAGGSKELSLKVAVPAEADGEIAFYVFLAQDGKIVAHSEALAAKASAAPAETAASDASQPVPAAVAPVTEASAPASADAEVADTAASFSGLALGPEGASAGHAAKLTVSVKNDSGQDWPAGAYGVCVSVSQNNTILRKTRPILIRKAVAAGQSKDLRLRVAVPAGASGDVAFSVALLKDDQVVVQSEPLTANLAASGAADESAAAPPAAEAAAPAEASQDNAPAADAAAPSVASADPAPVQPVAHADSDDSDASAPPQRLTRAQVDAELRP